MDQQQPNVLKPNVLIAEDNVAMAGLTEFTLQRVGCEVTVCHSGSKAVAAVKQRQFDFILTDYQMPGASGEDVIQAARANEPNAKTPIVLCSAKGYELDTVALIEQYNLCRVITKPFSPMEITELVLSLTQVPSSVA